MSARNASVSRTAAAPAERLSLRIALALVAFAGVAACSYLVYERLAGGTLLCATGGCETVQQSSYSTLLGVPVSVLGLAAWLGLLLSTAARGDGVRLVAAALALAGAGFSVYLVVVQVVRIGALCQWCLLSDALMVVAALLCVLRLRDADG